MLDDHRIGAALQAAPTPSAACEQLVVLANELGGKDNVTAVVARYS